MLFLHFRIGPDDFAMAARDIVEIVPLAPLKALRRGSADIAGSLDYRGAFIPVVDLCAREQGRPARARLSTRIIVVRAGAGLAGLVAENATTMLQLDPGDFAPFARGPHGLVQRIAPAQLLPQSLLEGAAA